MCRGHWVRWKDWERAQREEHDVTLVSDPETPEPVEPVAQEEPAPDVERERVPAGAGFSDL